MKLRVFVLCAAGWALSTALAGESGTKSRVRINVDEPTATVPAPSTGRTAPAQRGSSTATPSSHASAAKAAPATEDAAKKKKEPPHEVAGFAVSRGERGYLGIKVEDNTFKVAFYDKDKKPIPADVGAIAVRWPVQYQPNPERTLLTPAGDGKVMTSEKTVRPPFRFKLFLTLLKDAAAGNELDAETYVVDFAQ